jgi:hypothetical protein
MPTAAANVRWFLEAPFASLKIVLGLPSKCPTLSVRIEPQKML